MQRSDIQHPEGLMRSTADVDSSFVDTVSCSTHDMEGLISITDSRIIVIKVATNNCIYYQLILTTVLAYFI